MKTVLGDLQIVVDRHSDVLRNNALPFRILLALRTLGFALSPLAAAYGFLALLPFQLFSIEVWRLITCNFVGQNVLLFAWTVWSLHFGTNLIRQNNSNESLLKIYAITQILTTFLVCGVAYGLYAFSAKTALLYEAHVVDMVPLNCAVLVLIKQFLPDTILLDTPIGRIKYTHMPIIAVSLMSIFSALGITRPVVILQCVFAIQISWTYLRFFNPHESDAFYGDSSEHFVWARYWIDWRNRGSERPFIESNFSYKGSTSSVQMLANSNILFPRIFQPFCTVLGRICFRSLVKCGVCKRSVRHVDLNSLQSVGISLRGLDSTARDAERRRQKALRDLNERLNKTKKLETISWDEDAEEEKDVSGERGAVHKSGKQAEQKIEIENEEEPSTVVQPSETTESHA